MAGKASRKAGVILPLFALGLLGCAAVDQYASRAISYNLEAEAALDQGLLLNIVRAAHRWPMQFTTTSAKSLPQTGVLSVINP